MKLLWSQFDKRTLVLDKPQEPDLDALLDHTFGSTPLFFIQEFLRSQKSRSKQIRIGTTRRDVRNNLRDAIVSKRIGYSDLRAWLKTVEGWGRQHLYIESIGRGGIAYTHLLNTSALRGFLKRKGFIRDVSSDAEPASPYLLDEIAVDDEIARVSWRCHSLQWERREELDETRELSDGEYEFRAFRKLPRSDVSRLVIRKTDGIVLCLVDLPLGDDHVAVHSQMNELRDAIMSPARSVPVSLAPIISALDQGAVAAHGPRARRELEVDVAPTQARYRTDGAHVEFRSTSQALGYTESDPVRQVRNAMQIARFDGEMGKFRLNFTGAGHRSHDMVVSFSASADRVFLFSRMTDVEVFALVDQLLPLGRPRGRGR